MTRQKLKKISKTALIVLGGLLILYLGIIRPIVVRMEKAKFEKAATELEGLYSQIVAKVGQPDQVSRDKSCGYASRDFQRGPRSCSVDITFVIKNKDAAASTALAVDISKIIGTELYSEVRVTGKTSPVFIDYQDPILNHSGPVDESMAQGFKSNSGLQCSIRYTYPDVPWASRAPKIAENFKVELGCGGDAIAEFYHLDK